MDYSTPVPPQDLGQRGAGLVLSAVGPCGTGAGDWIAPRQTLETIAIDSSTSYKVPAGCDATAAWTTPPPSKVGSEADPGSAFTVSTSADAAPAAAASGLTFDPPSASSGPVQGVAFAEPTPGTWQITFTPQDGQFTSLAIGAPPGTQLPSDPADYTLADNALMTPPQVLATSSGDAWAVLAVAPAAADVGPLTLTVKHVVDPPSGTYAASLFTVATNLQPLPGHTVTGLTFGAATGPTRVAGVTFATGDGTAGDTATWTIGFSVADSIPHGGTVTVTAPGATFSLDGTYTLNGRAVAVDSASTGGFTITVPGGGIPAPGAVTLVVNGVTNPAAGTYGFDQFAVSTSADPGTAHPRAGMSFVPAGASAVSHVGVSTTAASITEGTSSHTWQYSFRTSGTGSLAAGSGTITLTGPAGTVFAGAPADYQIQVGTVSFAPASAAVAAGAPNRVTLTLPGSEAVPASADVRVAVASAAAPPAAADPAASLGPAVSVGSAAVALPVTCTFVWQPPSNYINDGYPQYGPIGSIPKSATASGYEGSFLHCAAQAQAFRGGQWQPVGQPVSMSVQVPACFPQCTYATKTEDLTIPLPATSLGAEVRVKYTMWEGQLLADYPRVSTTIGASTSSPADPADSYPMTNPGGPSNSGTTVRGVNVFRVDESESLGIPPGDLAYWWVAFTPTTDLGKGDKVTVALPPGAQIYNGANGNARVTHLFEQGSPAPGWNWAKVADFANTGDVEGVLLAAAFSGTQPQQIDGSQSNNGDAITFTLNRAVAAGRPLVALLEAKSPPANENHDLTADGPDGCVPDLFNAFWVDPQAGYGPPAPMTGGSYGQDIAACVKAWSAGKPSAWPTKVPWPFSDMSYQQTVTSPMTLAMRPTSVMQLDVMPYKIIYQPPGDASVNTFTVTQATDTSTSFSLGTQTANTHAADTTWSYFTDNNVFGVYANTAQSWDKGTVSTQTQASSTTNSETFSDSYTQAWQSDTGSTVNGVRVNNGALDQPGNPPYLYDQVALILHPQFAVWDVNGAAVYQLMRARSAEYDVSIKELLSCAKGTPLPIPGNIQPPITLTPYECASLAEEDPFVPRGGQSAYAGQSADPATTLGGDASPVQSYAAGEPGLGTNGTKAITLTRQEVSSKSSEQSTSFDAQVSDITSVGGGGGVNLQIGLDLGKGLSIGALSIDNGFNVDNTTAHTTGLQVNYDTSQTADTVVTQAASADLSSAFQPIDTTVWLDRRWDTLMFQVPAPTGPLGVSGTYRATPVVGSQSGVPGSSLTIQGHNFWSGAAFVWFCPTTPPSSGTGCVVSPNSGAVNDDLITAEVPQVPTGQSYDVIVETDGGFTPRGASDQVMVVSGPALPAPTVSEVTPALGPLAGGTPITITGTGFTDGSAVRFGSASARVTSVDPSGDALTAVSPPASASGTVDVTVSTEWGSSATSSSDRFTYAQVPGQPTGVVAYPGDGSATVAWQAPADGGSPITGYVVTSTPSGFTATVSGTVYGSVYTMTGLMNGQPYTFTVTAENALGGGGASVVSNTVTPSAFPGATVPGAPTAVVATASNESASVTWDPPASDGGAPVTFYTITSSPSGFTTTVAGNVYAATLSGLHNGTAYALTVSASNGVGAGPGVASNTVTPHPIPPRGPTGLIATAGNGQATVTWSPPADDGGSPITGYTVTASPGGATASVPAGSASATVRGLRNGTTYTFTATASNGVGTGASSGPSNTVTPLAAISGAQTMSGSDPTVTVDGITASGTGTGTLTLTAYNGDPGLPDTFKGAAAYFDAHLASASGVSAVAIRDCSLAGGERTAYWYDATNGNWAQASDQSYQAGPPACIRVTVNATTSPDLAELAGTPFAVVNPNPPAPPGPVSFGPAASGATHPASTSVSSSGGTLTTSDGAFSLTVPAGAITAPGTLALAESCSAPTGIPGDTVPASCVFTLTGASLRNPAAVTIQYRAAALAGLPVQRLSVYRRGAGGSWRFVPTSVDAAAGTVSAYVHGPGMFAVLADTQRFSDLPSGYPGAAGIDTVVGASIMDGFPGGTLQPDGSLTRAQFVKMLDLALGIAPVAGTSPFSDVPAGSWYGPYATAAAEAGIVNGVTPTTFGADLVLTREQMAVLLARAFHLTRAAALTFSDAATVDRWALPGVERAVAAGVLTGFPDGTLRPLAPASRAQAAQALAVAIGRLAP